MSKNKPLTVEEMIEALESLIDSRVGAIPSTMYGFHDPRMPIFADKPNYEIEVDFK